MLAAVLAFSAGTFICVASSDLLPELHFHRHDRVKLSIALAAGIALAWLIGLFEPHGHDFPEAHDETTGRPAVDSPMVVGLTRIIHEQSGETIFMNNPG